MNKYQQTWLVAALVAAVGLIGITRAADDQNTGTEPKKPHSGPSGQKHEGPGGAEVRRGMGMRGQYQDGMMGPMLLERMGEEVGINDEQKAKIKEIMEQHKTEGRAAMEKLGAERQALQKLITADTLDEKAIRNQAAKFSSLEADAAVDRAKIGQEIRAILTPEQQEKTKEMRAKWEERMKEHRPPVGEAPEKQ